MSLVSLTSRDSCTVKRFPSGTQDGEGFVSKDPSNATTAARGTLPTGPSCRIQPLDAKEQIQFGLRGNRRAWKLLFSTNPTITLQDMVEFTDPEDSSNTVQATPVEPSRNLDNQGRLYRAIVEQHGGEL